LSEQDFDLQPVLNRLGLCLWNMLSTEVSDYLAYTVDAIWDERDRLWILEVNTNPFVHPWLYAPIIDTLLDSR
jgi:hypothetical protein